jgi:hypothetical protein
MNLEGGEEEEEGLSSNIQKFLSHVSFRPMCLIVAERLHHL